MCAGGVRPRKRGMAALADTNLIYRGIRPLQKLGAQARDLAVNNPFVSREVIPQRLKVVPPDPWAGDAQRGRDMINGIFAFAGHIISRENLSWEPQGARPEWMAELHSFEFLRDLRSVGGDRARRMSREMVASWLAHYDKLSSTAGRADTTGLRLSAWISFHDFFCASADDGFRQNYMESIVKQARHLQRVLPGNLTGIALMRALKGLAYTGLALEGGLDRLETAFRLIFREIKEQILPDGAHISRCPQATFEFLQILVDLRTALTAARLDMPPELQHAIDRIAPALKFFRHGDGSLAQFNGAQEGNPNICDATLMHSGARGKAMKSLPHAGYEKIMQGRASIIMDVALAHTAVKYSSRAHAGLLAFEYSFGKDRVIVNCGSSPLAGPWRDCLRSTAAHSTLVIEDSNACHFDDKGALVSRPTIKHNLREDADLVVIDAEHDAYQEKHGISYNRSLRLQDHGETLKGEEILQGKEDVGYALRFHLHPGIQASVIAEGSEILLRARSGMGWKFKCEGADLLIEDSVYMGDGETPRRSRQIVLTGRTHSERSHISWVLAREKI